MLHERSGHGGEAAQVDDQHRGLDLPGPVRGVERRGGTRVAAVGREDEPLRLAQENGGDAFLQLGNLQRRRGDAVSARGGHAPLPVQQALNLAPLIVETEQVQPLVVDQLPEGASRATLQQRLARITDGKVPSPPLVDDFEAIGVAMEHFHVQEFEQAKFIMDRLEEEGTLPAEMPSPDFYYFLALSREKAGDSAGAYEAYLKTLELEPEHGAASEGRDRIRDGKDG